MRTRRVRVIVVSLAAIFVWYVWFTKYNEHHLSFRADAVPEQFWGVTFSKKYAVELDLDWRAAYLAMLDELQVSSVRIPIYWDDIDPVRDRVSYGDYDWMIAEALKRGVPVVPVIGRRVPRWPECHEPAWARLLPEKELNEEHLAMTKAAIDHFRTSEAIESWQIENEYFFPLFGECPPADPVLIQEEIAYLRSVDSRPIIITDSGELNSWREAATYGDILGTTMYRVVWNNYFGYFRLPWPAALYRVKAKFAGKKPNEMIVAELQAEPWAPSFKHVKTLTPEEAYVSFDREQFLTMAELARRTGFARAYFWGVEWWYWMKTYHNDATMWNEAKSIINTSDDRI